MKEFNWADVETVWFKNFVGEYPGKCLWHEKDGIIVVYAAYKEREELTKDQILYMLDEDGNELEGWK